jgi:hypothetical protein
MTYQHFSDEAAAAPWADIKKGIPDHDLGRNLSTLCFLENLQQLLGTQLHSDILFIFQLISHHWP